MIYQVSYNLKKYSDKYSETCMVCSSTAVVVKHFATYQIADISSCFDKNEKMDAVWTAFDKLKDEDGEVYLRELAVVLCGILTIPHSNAHYERMFSTV